MVRIVMILFILAGLMGGAWKYSDLRSEPVTPEIERELKREALAYLSSKPSVGTAGSTQSWEVFFAQSELSKLESSVPDENWFQSHTPYYDRRAGGGYRVSWVGFPGCELEKQPQDLVEFSDPELFDAQGFQCFSWWRVKVLFDKELKPESVIVDEFGTAEGIIE